MKAAEIAAWLGLSCEGDPEVEIASAAALDTAGAQEISFVLSRKAKREAEASRAGCLIAGDDFDNTTGRTLIRARDPRVAFAKVIARLHPRHAAAPGRHASAVVAPSAKLGEGVSVGACAVIEEDAEIGAGVEIGAQCFVGRGARIGEATLLHPHVTILDQARIGARCILHAGVVIGADGFGFARTAEGYEKFPQIGRVEIGDDVELGANVTIDRAALGVTRVGDGTKLDNMVHIAHNCQIGRHVLIVAQTGIAGGSVVEDWCVIGGQVGMGENVRIRGGAILGSKSGVLPGKTLAGGGQVYWGVPARPLKEYLEILALQARLPEMKAALDELRARAKGEQ
jgi:UDP-3-O-[3-hydroxymyristoyl] glucosamine N-acyltransferase